MTANRMFAGTDSDSDRSATFGFSRKPDISSAAKAAAGVLVLVYLLVRVIGFMGDYREAVSQEPASGIETTETVEATGTAGQGAEEGSASADESLRTSEGEDASESSQYVVVKIEGLNFRSDASSNSDVIRTLPKGTKLTLLGQRNGWYQVRDEEGVTGWVSASTQYVEVVSE